MKNVFLVSGLALVSLSAHAVVIDTYPDWTGNLTDGWFAQAQNFICPSDNVLSSWRFSMAAGTGNVTFGIFDWGAAGPVGSALYSTTAPWPSVAGPVDINNINLSLVVGSSYGAVIDLMGQSGPSVYFNTNQNSYSAGNAWWMDHTNTWGNFPGFNQTFRAVFSPVPEPASLSVLAIALLALRRRHRA